MKWIKARPEAGETLSHYATRLRVLARKADLETDENILYHIADDYSESNEEIYDKAMKKGVQLKDLLEWAASRDINLKARHSELKRVEFQRASSGSTFNRSDQRQRENQATNSQKAWPKSNKPSTSKESACNRCGHEYPHVGKPCPAQGKKCSKCSKMNHFAVVCRGSGKGTAVNKINDVNEALDTTDEDINNYTSRRIMMLNHIKGKSCPTLKVKINNTETKFVIDTGAPINVMTAVAFHELTPRPNLQPTKAKLMSYDSKQIIQALGQFETMLTLNNITLPTTFIVVDVKHTHENLLGFESLDAFGIVQIVHLLERAVKIKFQEELEKKYPSIFEDRIGCMKDVEVKLETDPNVKPTQERPRPIPAHMIPGTKERLDEMIKFDLIEAVPAGAKCSWISPMHPVEKSNGPHKPKEPKPKGSANQMRANVEKNRIRITSDNKRLNKAIIRMRRPMPSVSQLQFDLAGNKWFSKVDIRDAFLQVLMDVESRILTTF